MGKTADSHEGLIQGAADEYWRHTSELAFIKNLDGVYLRASRPFAALVGKASPEDVVGKTDFDIFESPALARRYTEDDARLLASGEPQIDCVEPIPSESGRPRYSMTSKYILRDEAGRPAGVYGAGRDITVEYEARRAFETELAGLFHPTDDTVSAALFDATAWRVIDARFREGTSYAVSKFTRVEEYIAHICAHLADDEGARAFFAGLTREGVRADYDAGKRVRSFEFLLNMVGGETRWVRDEIKLLLDPVNGHLAMLCVLRDIDGEKREYAELLRAAERDALTGLLNRDATVKCIERELATADGLQALFMIDLDNFKFVNDSFGHQYGDRILADAAAAILGVFRDTDVVGRVGGDEFMALMKNVRTEQNVRRKADELIAALQFYARSGDASLSLTTSVGVTLFYAGERSFDALYGEADDALYRSKNSGKNRYCLFGSERCERCGEGALASESTSAVHLHTLLDYMDGGVILAEVRDSISITYVSPSLYRTIGRGKGEPDDILSSVLPEDRPGLKTALLQMANSDEVLEYPYRLQTPGGVKQRRVRVKRMPEAGDGVHRLIGVVTDVSALYRANEQLRAAEERYRIAVELTQSKLWEVDVPSRTLRLTGSAWGSRGLLAREFPNAPESYLPVSGISPDSFETVRSTFADIYAGVERGAGYHRYADEHGKETWALDRYRLLYNEAGEVCCAIGVTQSVPNVSAEMRRFEHEVRFADIVRASLVGCVRANYTLNRVERADLGGDTEYAALTGLPFDEYLARVCAQHVHPEDAPALLKQVSREAMLEYFRAGESWRFIDYRRRAASGEYRWTSLFIKLMRHPVGGDVYAFGYLRDNQAPHEWELSLQRPLLRNASLLLYTRESFELLCRHVLAARGAGDCVAMSVLEIASPERADGAKGEEGVAELLLTFGRLCRIVVRGDVVMGQLDGTRIGLLRADAGSGEQQRERCSAYLTLLKALLHQAHPGATATIVAGFCTERASRAGFDQLLHRASVACRSAALALDETAVAYAEAEAGEQPREETDESGLMERYRALELAYQRQASLLRITENDGLTDILGKHAFYRRAREALDASEGTDLAIVRFDINRFKVFNDVRGTAAGDRLLRDIAGRVRQYAAGTAVVCGRLESDHFVLLVPNDAGAIQRSESALKRWLADYSPDYRLYASIGVYPITDRSVEVSLMCDRALLALQSVKSGFETRLAYYTDALRRRLLDEQQLVSDMEAALRTEEFELYFQPQVNYESGKLIGAEALVRWNHPTRGLLSPDRFIPLFEKNGLITRLDEYVWERCCRYIRDWTARYPQSRELSLSFSVNVSRLDIYQERLSTFLKSLIAKYGLPASALRLEITESAYMENPKQLIGIVRELQSAGFIVEMDDFGSGFSSLNTLKDVAVDILKLDMKFLDDCADRTRGGSILSSVIRMAHWLRLPIIAEGVETRAQADYLKSLGCVYMQGFYFARPMPADAFEKQLVFGAVSVAEQYRDTSIEGVAAFWDPSTQTALLFNSFVGGAAILEYRNSVLEASRVNDDFYRTLGTTREAYLPVQNNLFGCFDAENRERLKRELTEAIRTGEERDFEICHTLGAGGVTRPCLYTRMRLLAKSGDRSSILYLSIEDISDRKRMEQEREVEAERDRMLMETTGAAFFDYDYASDTLHYRIFLPERGVVRRSVPECSRYAFDGDRLSAKSADALLDAIQKAQHAHQDGEIEFMANLTGKGMHWWRMRYASVEHVDGRPYRLVGQADDIHDIKERVAISEAIRNRLKSETTAFPFSAEVVSQIFSLFYSASDIACAIETTLTLLGEYYDLSRTYVFEDTEGHAAMKNTFEWCAPDVAPQKAQLQHVEYEGIGGWKNYLTRFDENGVYYCPDVSTLASEERAVLEPQGIRSMLHYALLENGAFYGMVGFDECRDTRRWSEEQVGTLMFVSRIVGAYLLQMRIKPGGKREAVLQEQG